VKSILRIAAPLAVGAVVAGLADAGEVAVSANITGFVNWTADNTYNLTKQIYVVDGATLVIDAGVVVASTTGVGGSLAVANGGQLFVNGTRLNPVIFTSKADVATWDALPAHPTGGDPSTGSWREAANEWGNITIMGDAYISENAIPTNVPTPNASNYAAMEGLTEEFTGDTKQFYGGGNDDYDAGTLEYLSLRYGGKVIGLGNELNGLSLGGLGRGTDISYVEIMNNVDDGFEIWGGTVNVNHFSIWNIGDDSFDLDQGWRGKAQYGLIVQGWSIDATQGGGVGDNCIEIDGAEACNWQPVTSAVVYNTTVVGQPADGDYGTAWRDNARLQFRNMSFIDIGDKLVFNEGGGDGECGYGGKPAGDPLGSEASTFNELWTTPYNSYFATHWDAGIGVTQGQFYASMVDGNMIEIKDSVFYNLVKGLGDAPVDLTVGYDNVSATSLPVKNLVRDVQVIKGGTKKMQQVLKLDPRAANDALTSAGSAPSDGFFTPAAYRGGFEAGKNWVWGWTASDAFGFTTIPGSQTVRLGTVPNPAAFEVSATDPAVGNTWSPKINHTTFVPTAFLDFIAISGAKTDAFVPGFGSFLCGFNPALVVTNLAPGTSFTVPIPDNVNNVGVALCTQGGSFQLSGAITLANAIDIVIGNE
jgi:hypothetical protein